MTRRVEYDLGDFVCEMEFSDGIMLQHLVVPTFANIFKALRDLHATVALETCHFRAENAGGGRYAYGFTSRDGRTWAQVIDFSINAADPGMTFTVIDQWPVSEFRRNRPVRDELVILHNAISLEKLEASFLGG